MARLKSELNKQERLLTENMENSQVEIKPFNINELSVDILDDIEMVLSSRRQQWLKNNEDKNKLVQIIDYINNEQKHHNEIKIKLEKINRKLLSE